MREYREIEQKSKSSSSMKVEMPTKNDEQGEKACRNRSRDPHRAIYQDTPLDWTVRKTTKRKRWMGIDQNNRRRCEEHKKQLDLIESTFGD